MQPHRAFSLLDELEAIQASIERSQQPKRQDQPSNAPSFTNQPSNARSFANHDDDYQHAQQQARELLSNQSAPSPQFLETSQSALMTFGVHRRTPIVGLWLLLKYLEECAALYVNPFFSNEQMVQLIQFVPPNDEILDDPNQLVDWMNRLSQLSIAENVVTVDLVDALLRLLLMTQGHHHAPDWISKILSLSKLPPSARLFQHLLVGWKQSGRPEAITSMQQVLELMERELGPLTVDHYAPLLTMHVEQGADNEATKLLERMQEKFDITPTVSVYTTLVQVSLQHSRWTLAVHYALCALKAMESSSTTPTVERRQLEQTLHQIAQALQQQFEKTSVKDEGLRTELVAQSDRFVQSVLSYSNVDDDTRNVLIRRLVSMAIRLQQFERLDWYFDHTTWDSLTYYVVIKELGAQSAKMATHCYQKMPNKTTKALVAILNAWASSEHHDIALANAMELLETADPDLICYSIVLKMALKQQPPDGVLIRKLVAGMEDAVNAGDFDWDVVSYNTIIGALLKIGDEEKALAVFERMKTSATPPTERTYTNMIMLYADRKNNAGRLRAMQLFEEVHSSPSLRASEYMYSGVLKALAGDDDEVWRIYELALADGFRGRNSITILVIRTLANSDNRAHVQRASELLDTLNPAVGLLYYNVMKGLYRHNDADGVTRVLLKKLDGFLQSRDMRLTPRGGECTMALYSWVKAKDFPQATRFAARIVSLWLNGTIPEGPDEKSLTHLENGLLRIEHPDKEKLQRKVREMIEVVRARNKEATAELASLEGIR